MADDTMLAEVDSAAHEGAEQGDNGLEEGKLLDYITGQPLPDTPKEQVRQRIARAIIHEYGIAAEDMAPDFRLKIDGKNKKIDIAIFRPGTDHTAENLYRVVICQKEPVIGTRGAYRLRDPKEAEREFELLKGAMGAAENCQYGLWTRAFKVRKCNIAAQGFARRIGSLPRFRHRADI